MDRNDLSSLTESDADEKLARLRRDAELLGSRADALRAEIEAVPDAIRGWRRHHKEARRARQVEIERLRTLLRETEAKESYAWAHVAGRRQTLRNEAQYQRQLADQKRIIKEALREELEARNA